MNRHTDQLYRLTCLPAFIEEALGNVSLKAVIAAIIAGRDADLRSAIQDACVDYAETWVDDWVRLHRNVEFADTTRDIELRAIAAGEELFSRPVCTAGLPA